MMYLSFQNIGWIFTIGGWVVTGIFVLINFFGTDGKARRQESNDLADGLIKRLKETADQQGKDIAEMQANAEAQQKEIHVLQGQNEAYLKIITLRNPEAEGVFKEAPAAFKAAIDTNAAVAELVKSVNALVKALAPLAPAQH